jgi:HlyD family secretion protein
VLSVSLQCVAVRDKEKGKAVELKEKEQPKSSRELAAQARQGTQDTSKAVAKAALEEGVFTPGGDNAVWKPVRTGLSSDRYIEIASGLAQGDTVISGPYRALAKDLTAGDRVKIKPPEKDKKGNKKS